MENMSGDGMQQGGAQSMGGDDHQAKMAKMMQMMQQMRAMMDEMMGMMGDKDQMWNRVKADRKAAM